MVRSGRKVGERVMKGVRVAIEGVSKGSSTRYGITNSPPVERKQTRKKKKHKKKIINNQSPVHKA